MSLAYKGRILHDAGCSCCALTFADASIRLDPTGTGRIRRAMASAMTIKWNSLRPMLRAQLIQNDILGLNIRSIQTAMSGMMAASMAAGGATKVEVFQRLFDTMLQNTVLAENGDYVKTYISAGYSKGSAFGNSEIDTDPRTNFTLQGAVAERIATLQKFTFVEMQGVAEAVSQQAVRIVANGLLAQQPAGTILRAIFGVLSKVGRERTNTIAEFMVVRAFNEGVLDAYEAAGLTHVALVPETRPTAVVTDARKQRRVTGKRKGAGSRISRTQQPSNSTIARIRRQERELERLSMVNVRTAGDDRVCPICEDIADDGPYTINHARSLIPAHPRCRCTFVPANDRRYARDEDKRPQLS